MDPGTSWDQTHDGVSNIAAASNPRNWGHREAA